MTQKSQLAVKRIVFNIAILQGLHPWQRTGVRNTFNTQIHGKDEFLKLVTHNSVTSFITVKVS